MPFPEVRIIGGGLAGVEAAHFLARKGVHVDLFEMRPSTMTPAHSTDKLAELVCSNSFKGADPLTAHGILKREMEALGSLVMQSALHTRVPAGKALAVDRTAFASLITEHITATPLITLHREEVTSIEEDIPTIIATGPLTSDALAANLASLTGTDRLFFYDAISPIIETESIIMDQAFYGSRWTQESDDYLNCPLDEECYNRFVDEILKADKVRSHEFEDAFFFEACLPIEVLALRGRDALRYGPMRPVGLMDPAIHKRPFAVVQLRKENLKGNACTMVGFQTRLTYPEQRRIMGIIPALAHANYLRYGSIHRNTYIDSPRVLEADMSLKGLENVFLAGQITGVEGYMESSAIGMLSGISVLARLMHTRFHPPGPDTAIGALVCYITDKSIKDFQPMNINFGIMTLPDVPKNRRTEARSEMAKRAFDLWRESMKEILEVKKPTRMK